MKRLGRHLLSLRSGLGVALLLLVAGLSSAGCNTYSYFEVHVKLEDAFSTPRRAMIHTCHLFVTGAATTDTTLNKCSPPDTNDVGVFDYSTFSESGSVTFTLKLFKMFEDAAEANKIGEGATTLTISSGNTVKGDLTVMYTGPADMQ